MTPTSCVCGHSIEEHGGDPKYPGSTACSECGCIAFEADHSEELHLHVRSDDVLHWNVRPGGLMRCCLETLEKSMQGRAESPKEGETMQCKYHDGEGMIYRNGAWEWNHDSA